MNQDMPSPIKTFARKILLVLSTGLIFWLVSEGLFYGLVQSTDTAFGYSYTGAIYCYAAWLFLILVSTFRIKNNYALFLAGAFFGWMIEGVLVFTMYGVPDTPFPISIPVTGLSWHALLTVMVGLYGTRLALRQMKTTVLLAVAIGMFWGIWAATWRSADEFLQVNVESFFTYTCTLTFLFVIGHLVWQKCARVPLSFGKWETRLALAGTTLYFLLITVQERPTAVFILPPILALGFFALKRNQKQETPGDVLYTLADEIPATRYLPFMLVPLIADSIYAITEKGPDMEFTMLVVTVITGVIGSVAFIVSVVKLFKIDSSNQYSPG